VTRRLAAAVLGLVAGCAAPPTPDARLEAADRSFAQRDWAAARDAYATIGADALARRDPVTAWRAGLGHCRAAFAAAGFAAEALACFDDALALAAGVAGREAETAYHACFAALRLGRMEQAEAWAQRALQAAERTDDARARSQAYGALGNVRSYQGRYRDSLDWNTRRVDVWRRAGPGSAELANALNNVAIDHRHLGHYDTAAAALEEALALYRARGDEGRSGPVLYNLANIRLHAGQREAGLALKLDALRVAEQRHDTAGQGLALTDLGGVYREAGDLSRARDHLVRALAIQRQDRRAYGEALALQGLASIELDAQDPAAAADLARQALELADGGDLGKERAVGRCLLAIAEARLGRHARGIELAHDALARAIALDDPDVELQAREALAAVFEAAGRPAEAAAAHVGAVDLLDSLRGRLELGDLRLGFAEPLIGAHEGAIANLLALGQDAEAFAIGERARARLLLELVAEHAAGDPADPIAALRAELREKSAEHAAAEGRRREALAAEIRGVERRLDAAIERERETDPLRSASRHPRPRPIDELRALLVRPGRPLLAWFWGERQVYGWRLDEATVRGAALGPAPALAAQVDFLRRALASAGDGVDWRPAAASVFSRLVAPLYAASDTAAVVVPDGPLALVPLEALPRHVGAPPLGAEATLYYGPSASVLAALAAAPPAGPFERDLLAVGVPGRVSAASSRALRAADFPLPHAAREAREIVAALDGRACDTLIGASATLPGLLALDLRRYRWLHFATHARVVEQPVTRSSLTLHGADLDLAGVRALHLDAEMVTLSACDTALGQRLRGEGVVGMTHAFLSAGARGVVASLWKVEDRATADFMNGFYVRLARGSPAAKALRDTRAELLGRGAHPAAWAAFVLVGGIR